MPVQFAALTRDGVPYLDGGGHHVTVSDALATRILTKLGLPTTVPGQAPAQDVYQLIIDYQESAEGQALNPQQQADVEKVRIALALGWRGQPYIIDWR